MVFYDFEVFQEDWLAVFLNPSMEEEKVIVNDAEALKRLYEENQNEIWVGFNNLHYDQYIFKGVLLGMNPKEINDFIIVQGRDGWQYSDLFRQIKMLNYDVFSRIDRGLKFFEGSLGNMVKESSVDFMIPRKLTEAEIQETIKYCRHDVEQTVEVFIERKSDFDAIIGLINMFPEVLSIDDIGLTKAQISAKILECEARKRTDEFDLLVLPCIQIRKYKKAIDWYMNFQGESQSHATEIYKQSLTMMISGLEHEISWGGIHAGKEKYKNLGKKQGRTDLARGCRFILSKTDDLS